jgi:hypothetical protein
MTERRAIQLTVSSGNAHHRRPSRFAAIVGGGNGTLVVTVVVSSIVSLVSVTTIDVVTRAALVALLAAVALWSIWRIKPATNHERSLVRVVVRPTPLYRSPENKERAKAAGQLGFGAIVVGMLFALVVSVLVAYLFSAVTGLLN